MLDLEILPVLLNPNSQDSDVDYYKDSSDPQPLKRTPMIIYDNKIDDTLLFDETAAPKEKQINTLSEAIEIDDGTLIYTDPKIKNKPKFQYDRIMSDPKNTRIYTFTLTPRNKGILSSFECYKIKFDTLQEENFYLGIENYSRELDSIFKTVLKENYNIDFYKEYIYFPNKKVKSYLLFPKETDMQVFILLGENKIIEAEINFNVSNFNLNLFVEDNF